MHPRGSCSVCTHPQGKAIDQALTNGTASLRALAGQFSLSKTSLLRHKRNHLEIDLLTGASKDAVADEETRAIDAEIARLKRAQTRADRRRDDEAKLKISRELRTWLELRAKLRAKRPVGECVDQEPASPQEALQLAQGIIELNLAGSQRNELLSWLEGLLERAVATNSATGGVMTQQETGVSA